MSKVLKEIGIAIAILAFITGIVDGNQDVEFMGQIYKTSFQWGVAFYWWVGGALSCILFFVFGRVIEQLEFSTDYLSKILQSQRNIEDIEKKRSSV
ncbi:hypothetical protein D1872_205900 [compost metagenome]